jgi:cytochrome c biogenesis protein CcmG/thiol:disulfide interchange protein DsbE
VKQRQLAIFSLGIAILIVAAAIAWYFVHPSRSLQTASQSPVVGKAQVGQPAPEFEVATTDGLFDLAKTDKPVFLEVFATWCPHCQRETTVIDKLYKAYGSRVAFVGVSGSETAMDGTSESSQLDVLNWAQRFNVRYPVAYDPLLNVANLYLQGGFPTFAVIGKDKKVAYLNSGELSYADLANAINKVL